jgi:hypothetical protein
MFLKERTGKLLMRRALKARFKVDPDIWTAV